MRWCALTATEFAQNEGAMLFEKFDHETAVENANRNLIVTVYGDSKSGKTHFAVRCERPLYMIYLDPLPSLDFALLKAEAEGYTGDVYKLVIPPMAKKVGDAWVGQDYEHFSKADAERIVDEVKQAADHARASAAVDTLAGRPGGTLVVDGMSMFKGYLEKAVLGESASLGWRAERGERGGPSRFDYAKSNAAMRDFVMQFSGSKLDVVLVWEASRVYVGGEPTNRFKSTRPDRLPYCISAEVETVKVKEPVVRNNETVGTRVVPHLRIGWNTYDPALEDRLMLARGFDGLKRLFLVDVPAKRVEEELRPEGPVELAPSSPADVE